MLTFDNFARSTRPSFCQLAGYRWLPYGKRPSIYMYVGDACPHAGDFPHPIIPKAGIKQSADQGRGNFGLLYPTFGREKALERPISQVGLALGSQACPSPLQYLLLPTITATKPTIHILYDTGLMKTLRFLPSQIQAQT